MSGCTRGHSQGGMTLVEILIALGILAFGASVAIGLISAATTFHARAVFRTQSALLADAALEEARGQITAGLDAAALPSASGAPGARTLARDAEMAGFADHVYATVLTPVGTDDPAEADAFLVETAVRHRAAPEERAEVFRTVAVRRVMKRDLTGP